MSKAQVDAFVKHMVTSPIPVASEDGCDAKADIFCRLLQANQTKGVKKILATGIFQPDLPSGDGSRSVLWKWHVACIIKARDGKEYIVDPGLNPREAMTKEEWKNKLTNGLITQCNQEEIFSSEYTYDFIQNKKVLVTNKIFTRFTKSLSFYEFTDLVPPNSLLEKQLLGHNDFSVPLPKDGIPLVSQRSKCCCIS